MADLDEKLTCDTSYLKENATARQRYGPMEEKNKTPQNSDAAIFENLRQSRDLKELIGKKELLDTVTLRWLTLSLNLQKANRAR